MSPVKCSRTFDLPPIIAQRSSEGRRCRAGPPYTGLLYRQNGNNSLTSPQIAERSLLPSGRSSFFEQPSEIFFSSEVPLSQAQWNEFAQIEVSDPTPTSMRKPSSGGQYLLDIIEFA
jgi:hypothetical protein